MGWQAPVLLRGFLFLFFKLALIMLRLHFFLPYQSIPPSHPYLTKPLIDKACLGAMSALFDCGSAVCRLRSFYQDRRQATALMGRGRYTVSFLKDQR